MKAINNKINYLYEINQISLKKDADIIKHICNDEYTINRIFPLYNNDYRTAMKSLCKVLIKNRKYAQQYCKMTEEPMSANHFGAHGIVLRLILDSFEKQGYFRSIGSYNVEENNEDSIEIENNDSQQEVMHDLVDYSIPRLILTYLLNYQNRHEDNFLNNPPDNDINLKKLYNDFCKIISPQRIAEKLEAMFSLHELQDWSHLITINASYDIKSSIIKEKFDKYEKGGLYDIKDGNIQITCAGRTFVRRITTHYEYFACRYFEKSEPLFSDFNLNKENGIFKFEVNMRNVYGRIEECIKKAYAFDKKIIEKYFKGNIAKFKQSHYLYKSRGVRQTHAERIIYHNISYIDAYRHYIIYRHNSLLERSQTEGYDKIILEEGEEICRIIIEIIGLFINLMKSYIDIGYFSGTELYNQYIEGLNKIGTNYLSDIVIDFNPKGKREEL